MMKLSINVTKIPRERIVEGKKGKYLDLVLHERPDDYGNDGFVAVDVTKAERESGVKGPIVGNWKHIGQKSAPAAARRQAADPDLDSDGSGIPF